MTVIGIIKWLPCEAICLGLELSFSFNYLLQPLNDPAVRTIATCFGTTYVKPEHRGNNKTEKKE